MAEIFRRHLPETAQAWTGERLVTGIEGQIESEHLHRYFLARDLCRSKAVLDVASGEGYGSALLAQVATSVIGVDIDPASVAHATGAYAKDTLRFVQGNATRLPLEGGSVDVVVSFETLEHFAAHEAFMAEVRRVLRPDGLLVISTPNVAVYSGPGTSANPFHVRELTGPEFSTLLLAHFRHLRVFHQRVSTGSALIPELAGGQGGIRGYERRDPTIFEAHDGLPRAPYLVGIASDAALPDLAGSLYIAGPDATGEVDALRAEVHRLHAAEMAALQKAAAQAALAAEREALTQELRASAAREAADAEARARAAAERIETLQAERDTALAAAEHDRAAARQRGLAVQRLQLDLVEQGHALAVALAERDAARAEATRHGEALAVATAERDVQRADAVRYAQAYDRVSRLVVPVWMRRLAPPALRQLSRARLTQPR